MSSRRFAVSFLVGRAWEPATLTLHDETSRNETLGFIIHSARSENKPLARGESFSETIDQSATYFGAPRTRGYSFLRFEMDDANTVDTRKRRLVVETVAIDEILDGARKLRRSKPKRPTTRMANDEIFTCVTCGTRSMSRGSETSGWKGVQMSPDSSVFDYFCPKQPCTEAREAAIDQAKVNWGWEVDLPAVDPIVAEQKPETVGPQGGKYGPPPKTPFL